MALYQKDFEKLLFKNDLLIYSFFICYEKLLLYSKILKMSKMFCFIVSINFTR